MSAASCFSNDEDGLEVLDRRRASLRLGNRVDARDLDREGSARFALDGEHGPAPHVEAAGVGREHVDPRLELG
jgi:hypothetical protein